MKFQLNQKLPSCVLFQYRTIIKRYVASVLLVLLGIILIVITVIFAWVLFPGIIYSQVEKRVRLVEGSDTWKKWKEAPIPIYLTFYIYHVTNPDEVESGLVAKIQEKGPYAYRQKRIKVDIKQEKGKNTVKYRQVKTFYFDQEKSGNNREDDLVNVPNIPFVGVIHSIYKRLLLKLMTGIVGNVILQGEPLIRRNTKVKELLFEGFDVTKYTNSLLLSGQLPKEFSGGRFGLYKGKNGTKSEVWEVYTGVENSSAFGKVKTWNGRSELGFWRKNSECDKIKGTDGSVFPPFIRKDSKLYAFSTNLCRSLALEYSEDVEHLGIQGYRFRGAKGGLEDPRVNKANRCYCLEDNIEKCAHAGVLSLESCLKAPIWSSPPHFLDSDIRYLKDSGLDPPEREKHETFLDIEPITGLLLRAHGRLQINLEVRRNRKVKALKQLKKDQIIFPVIWADESAEIDEKLANELKRLLFTPVKIVGIVKWVVLLLGIVLIIVGVYVSVHRYNLVGDKDIAEKDKNGIDLAHSSASRPLSFIR